MKPYLTIAHIFLYLLVSGSAHAQSTLTLMFDSISLRPGESYLLPNGYSGLQWVNLCAMNPVYAFAPASGFLNSVVSPNNVIWNASGNPAQISSSVPFDLDSAYMTAAWMDGLQVEAQGFVGSVMTYDNVYSVNTTSPTLVNFNYTGVDQVNFIASGGTLHYFQGEGSEFAIDNMVLSVPEPAGINLLLYGLVCGGAVSQIVRRQQ